MKKSFIISGRVKMNRNGRGFQVAYSVAGQARALLRDKETKRLAP
jgi:hypothetical protein